MKHNLQVGLLGISYDRKSSFLQGAALAPQFVRESLFSEAFNAYSENMVNVLDKQHLIDLGDLTIQSYDHINTQLLNNLHVDRPLLMIGGDHSISYPLVKAHVKKFGPFHILHFDAHADLYDELVGDKYSHACPFARIMEESLAISLTQVGIRTLTPHQRDQADRFGVSIFEMKKIDTFDPLNLKGPLYMSLDMDVFDPAFAPGVSHPEPGGLSSRSMIEWLQQINVPVLGVDIVEYNPLRDLSGITAALTSKLTKEIIDLLLRNPIRT
jgi:agmatinase